MISHNQSSSLITLLTFLRTLFTLTSPPSPPFKTSAANNIILKYYTLSSLFSLFLPCPLLNSQEGAMLTWVLAVAKLLYHTLHGDRYRNVMAEDNIRSHCDDCSVQQDTSSTSECDPQESAAKRNARLATEMAKKPFSGEEWLAMKPEARLIFTWMSECMWNDFPLRQETSCRSCKRCSTEGIHIFHVINTRYTPQPHTFMQEQLLKKQLDGKSKKESKLKKGIEHNPRAAEYEELLVPS